ncbi:4-hydroxy-tetrahydrodipicolinate reductase [Haloplasma contractile]|uniref:4-hydroxy-tetrahydrodipicolinate reductase n=1 Tax=Haloplasma contractile SSD-17B TaxID=1033810 RepID=F7Q174_9MOLU|nr:dihydrodipicolinate reductase C-terminal domain-containing protein [Haloplasma contractile]ERJ12791.1 4-hydroxy-tetrahydrodipicolinate reductase protein [Haloplasma contractile SSD-17B]
MKVIINGIFGKMGSFLYEYLKSIENIEVVGGIDRTNKTFEVPIYNHISECLLDSEFDVLVDFTIYPSCLDTILFAINNEINVVSGTTGYKEADVQIIEEAARKNKVGVFISPNFSKGTKYTVEMLKKLKDEFKSHEIIEEHSTHKKDKPSGTAKYLARVLDMEIDQVHSIRLPNILANHQILFADEFETISISHTIHSRDAFLGGIEEAIRLVYNENFVKVNI